MALSGGHDEASSATALSTPPAMTLPQVQLPAAMSLDSTVPSNNSGYDRLSTGSESDVTSFPGLNQHLTDHYQLGQQIGRGAFGVVREAIDIATGDMYCCKSIPRASLTAETFADIKLEAEIMMHLRGHANIVSIRGLFEDESHIHIVEEMCSGGDLYSKYCHSPCTEKEVSNIMRAVLMVLQHCHAMGVIYRDCKPDNFLLSSKGPEAILKATDFGISKFLRPDATLDVFCGTPAYMAPEVFDLGYSYPADVWSAGVMMYWMLCGDFPFKGKNEMELAHCVYATRPNMEGGVWDQITPSAKDIIKCMLEKNPSKRPTPTELLEHVWFKEMAKVKAKGQTMLQRMRQLTKTAMLFTHKEPRRKTHSAHPSPKGPQPHKQAGAKSHTSAVSSKSHTSTVSTKSVTTTNKHSSNAGLVESNIARTKSSGSFVRDVMSYVNERFARTSKSSVNMNRSSKSSVDMSPGTVAVGQAAVG